MGRTLLVTFYETGVFFFVQRLLIQESMAHN
uniref:Uncharacterized protein n=1 Tax=Lepeophtheirus salmonis TaxID=72036 RepID=A0A0K2TFW7_LEPSM